MLTHEEGLEQGYPPSDDYDDFNYDPFTFWNESKKYSRALPISIPKKKKPKKAANKPVISNRKKKTPIIEFDDLAESDQKICMRLFLTGRNQA